MDASVLKSFGKSSAAGTLSLTDNSVSWTRKKESLVIPFTNVFAVRYTLPKKVVPKKPALSLNVVSASPTTHLTVFQILKEGSKGVFTSNTFIFNDIVDSDSFRLSLLNKLYPNTQAKGTLPRRRILAVLNPFGGTKAAKKLWETIYSPLLTLADVQIKMFETSHSKHSTEIAINAELALFDAALIIGGDGVFHEFMNGLGQRSDWEIALKLPMGYFPGGTSNALAKNLDASCPLLAVMGFLSGTPKPLDMMHVRYADNTTYFLSHLMMSWALIADVDIESENYRWAGSARFDINAVIRILKLRKYNAKIHYLPEDQADLTTTASTTGTLSGGPQPKLPLILRSNEEIRVPETWKTFEGPLCCFIATNLAWIAPDFLVSPTAQINDGTIHLVWIPEGNTTNLLSIMMNREDGSYLKNKAVQFCKVKAFILEPISRANHQVNGSEKGILDIDGEVVPCDSVQVEILPGLASIICPSWLS